MQMATGGCSMQRCPTLAVSSIDIGPSLQELLCHLLEVVNAALQTSNLSPIHTLAPARPGSLTPPLQPLTWCSAVKPSSLARLGLTPLVRNWRTARRGRQEGSSRDTRCLFLQAPPTSYKHGAQGRKESPPRLDLSLY